MEMGMSMSMSCSMRQTTRCNLCGALDMSERWEGSLGPDEGVKWDALRRVQWEIIQ